MITPINWPQVKEANDIPATLSEPQPGYWILFKPGKAYSVNGHAGIVMAVGTSTIKVVESNYKKGEITVREISKWDKNIRGYFK